MAAQVINSIALKCNHFHHKLLNDYTLEDEDVKPNQWHFPWISIVDSDMHVLGTTNTRLESNNPELARKSCEFLNDVLFKDFPAEIFLQRPNIVKVNHFMKW